jgi:hypothetical protein
MIPVVATLKIGSHEKTSVRIPNTRAAVAALLPGFAGFAAIC